MGAVSLGLTLVAVHPAAAENWRNGQVAAAAYAVSEPASATVSYGRSSHLGVAIPAAGDEDPEPATSVMDCSSEPLVGGSSTTQGVSQPFACYSQEQWPQARFDPAGMFDDLIQ